MAKKKILVVEDNDLNLKLYSYALRSVDAELSIAKNGNDAIDLAKKIIPDLLILDIQIPGKSGIDVAKEIRGIPTLSNIKIIAVTAYSMAGDKEKILAAGCNYYLSKPIDTRAFPVTIQTILDGNEPNLK